jgi:hypothetical protein
MASGSTSSTWNAGRVRVGDPWSRPQGPRAERPLPGARGSICPLCSTWNPSPGVPQPGRAPLKINGPWSLGKNSTTEDLPACGECAGFAAAPEADHGGDHGHADAPISAARRPAAAAVLFAVTASARSQAATGRRPASGRQQLTAPVASAQGNAAGAPPDDASANLASGSSVSAVLTRPVDSTHSRPGDPVSARASQIATTEGGTSIPKHSLSGHVSEARAGASVTRGEHEIHNRRRWRDCRIGPGATRGAGSFAGVATGALQAGPGAMRRLDAAGMPSGSSTDVSRLRSLSLSGGAADAATGSVMTSTRKSVYLDPGTRLPLSSRAAAFSQGRTALRHGGAARRPPRITNPDSKQPSGDRR